MSTPTPPNAQEKQVADHAFQVKVRPDPVQGRIVLGRFRINSKLARGGMSTVYLARDVEEGGLVAVKILRQDLVLDTRIYQRFLYESRAMQRIDHPAIVPVYNIGEIEDGRICLVMEYIHGSSLRRLIQQGPIKYTNAIPIVGSVCQGLAAAHENFVIHRDLKPENVLIPQKSTSGAVAKLVDFGIARIIDMPSITTTQHVMGTPHYIAPEQAIGKQIDHRVDIYSLGVLIYEMLTNSLPFSGNDPDKLLRQHINDPPPPLDTHSQPHKIPDKLEKLVMRCLSKSPEDRPNHMDEVISTLSEIRP